MIIFKACTLSWFACLVATSRPSRCWACRLAAFMTYGTRLARSRDVGTDISFLARRLSETRIIGSFLNVSFYKVVLQFAKNSPTQDSLLVENWT